MPKPRVAAPPVQTAAHGLLAAMLPPADAATDVRWENGFDFEPMFDVTEAPESGTFQNAAQDVGAVALPPAVDGEPFVLHRRLVARTFAGVDADLEVRAREALGLQAGYGFERALWSNPDSLDTPHLTDATAGTAISATAVAPAQALGELIDQCGLFGRGFIHAGPKVAGLWARDGLLKEVAGTGARTLQTIIGGHTVVVGQGYAPGTGLDTTPAGSEWAMVTGVVVGELGPVSVSVAAPNRGVDATVSSQAIDIVATQTARIYFDPGTLAGLPVDLS